MRVAIIDPSCFTMPYDHCLCEALARLGCVVLFVGSRCVYQTWSRFGTYERLEHFYRLTNRLYRNRPSGLFRSWIKGIEHIIDMRHMVERLDDWKPDVIHFQWIPLPIVDRLFLEQLRKIAPLVLTVHDTELFHGAPSSWFQVVGWSSTLQRFDHYIVHTHYSKEVLVRQKALPEHRVTVIPHGVFTYYRELIDGLETSGQVHQLAGKKKVLFFGVLRPNKGVDVLLEAFARLPELVAKDTVLQIVGYPRMPVEPLQALARRLGIEDRVFWDLRYVEEKEVALYFTQADVVVLPYRLIDQSGVLMVALAFGKPIVASRIGGFAEIICDGLHGFLVEPGDVVGLALALARVLGDDRLRTRMAEAVKKLASNQLSWESIAAKTMEVYKLLQRNRTEA